MLQYLFDESQIEKKKKSLVEENWRVDMKLLLATCKKIPVWFDHRKILGILLRVFVENVRHAENQATAGNHCQNEQKNSR
jgi:hypothetical protein